MPKAEEVSMDRGITLIKIDRQKVTSEFVAELLKQPSIQTEMGVNVHASAIGHLFMNRVKKLPAILPSMESQAEFTAFVRQVDKSKVAVQKSLDETQLLFNSLMQKYFG
jgi:type I restriction enzyme S subunit